MLYLGILASRDTDAFAPGFPRKPSRHQPTIATAGLHADFHFAAETLRANFTDNLVDAHGLQSALDRFVRRGIRAAGHKVLDVLCLFTRERDFHDRWSLNRRLYTSGHMRQRSRTGNTTGPTRLCSALRAACRHPEAPPSCSGSPHPAPPPYSTPPASDS